MNYTVYFKDGGLLPRSQRRVYQTGGKASAQDTMQQLYQLTQVAVSGSGQEQRQAMQALGQFVGEAMNGNEQYAQIIQAVFDGAKKGSREMTQMAQVFQSIMQQMQKREFGGRLDYITMLRNGGRKYYQPGGKVKTYGEVISERLGKIGPIVRNLGRRLGFGKGVVNETAVNDEPSGYYEPDDNVAPPVQGELPERQYPEPIFRDEQPLIDAYEVHRGLYGLRDPYWYGRQGDYDEYLNGYADLADYERWLREYRQYSGDTLPFQSGLAMPK